MLFGLHLGIEAAAGTVPGSDGSPYDASNFGSSGVAYGLDGGFRFARHFYVGLTLDHAALNTGTHKDLSNVAKTSSSTSSLGLILAFIGNPDRVSFYGEVGAASRWYDVHETDATSGVEQSRPTTPAS